MLNALLYLIMDKRHNVLMVHKLKRSKSFQNIAASMWGFQSTSSFLKIEDKNKAHIWQKDKNPGEHWLGWVQQGRILMIMQFIDFSREMQTGYIF